GNGEPDNTPPPLTPEQNAQKKHLYLEDVTGLAEMDMSVADEPGSSEELNDNQSVLGYAADKSLNSFKEIGNAVVNGFQTRADKSLDSPYDFVNYATMGTTNAVVSGAQNRAEKMWDSPYDFANWLSFGIVGTIKGAIAPEEPLSAQHWLDSFGVAALVTGGIEAGLTVDIEATTSAIVVEGTGGYFEGFVAGDNMGSMLRSEGTGEADPLGGAYKDVPANGGQVHHMPANSVSPYSRGEGPGIRMETDDHMDTASWGSSKKNQEYRAQQKELIDNGKFEEAQQMDINDVRSKFGNKYDEGIQQMLDYTKRLRNMPEMDE
ncbi:hypothetical protein SAMN04487897_107198, partial [Paenibacillus sp. yr247]